MGALDFRLLGGVIGAISGLARYSSRVGRQ